METVRTGPVGETVDTPQHRALGSASRVTILRLVRQAPAGLTTGEVAVATGLHLSTVRAHLDRLAGAGLLVKSRDPGGTPGRPAWRYRPAAPAPAPGSYRGLAAALLEHLGDGTAAGRTGAAIRVGESWGHRLALDTAPGAEPVDGVRRVLDGLGFAPRPAPGSAAGSESAAGPTAGPAGDSTAGSASAELHLAACPFLDLVATDPDPICALHLGVIRGVLAELGSPAADSAVLEPFGAPTACVARVPAGARVPAQGRTHRTAVR